ncbi:MAG: acetolactate synthase small subunit [Deltaproteobacteria bacterium]|nr:acetolactate synthase small subunit [Deltaproteobacteria bacterium]
MKHTISILVDDQFGALARIVELFTSRGYNLDSICSGEAETLGTHRITIVTKGDDPKIKQIIKLLNNIIYVFEVTHLSPAETISGELMLAKLKITPEQRNEILQLIQVFEGQIIEMNGDSISFQVVGSASKLDGVTSILKDYELIAVSRTGEAAIHK